MSSTTYFLVTSDVLWITQADPYDIFDAFFGGSDGIFGVGDELGGMNFNFRNNRKRGLDIR